MADVFEEITSRLSRACCPVCLNTHFLVVLRCDRSLGDVCALVGECQHCHTLFDIRSTATLSELEEAAGEKLTFEHCVCGGELTLRFLCDLESEDCYFEAGCTTCGLRWRLAPAIPTAAAA